MTDTADPIDYSALTVDLDAYPPRHDLPPWLNEGRKPTAAEWLTWVEALTPETRLWFVNALIKAATAGDRCRESDHASYPAQLERTTAALLAEVTTTRRYRLAWQSARRRAQQIRDAADSYLDDVPVGLALNEATGDVAWLEDPMHPDHPHAADLTDDPKRDGTGSWWTCAYTDPRKWPRPVHLDGPCPAESVPVDLAATDTAILSPQDLEPARRTTCAAGLDGECYADGCVQTLDGEPMATGRFCPLPSGNPLVALREQSE